MDPLASLTSMVPPDLTARIAAQTQAQDASPLKSIPLPELSKLNYDLAPSAAGDTVNGLLSGKNVSLHQAMISMEEASVSFSLMVEVRNKLLDSYQELMRMQI